MMRALVVGLGNPGYKNTRHNAGADYLNHLLTKYDHQKTKDKNLYIVNIESMYVLFYICPNTMNISGPNIANIYKKYQCNALLVCVDELDLKLGQYKLIKNGGAKGHNGIRSILAHFSLPFYILRIGISRPVSQSVSEYVLDKFTANELEILSFLYKQIMISDILKNISS